MGSALTINTVEKKKREQDQKDCDAGLTDSIRCFQAGFAPSRVRGGVYSPALTSHGLPAALEKGE